MKPKVLLFLVLSVIVASTIALPIPEEERNPNSLGQHLGRAGLLVLGAGALIGMGIGVVTYATNWWHRFKLIL